MSLTTWFALVAASLIISFTPGAGAVNTMTNSLAVGHRRALWGILGQQLALIVHLLLVAAGLGVLVSRSPLAFEVVRWAGVAYLVFLGIRLILARPQDSDTVGGPAPASGWSMFRRGLWVNLLNPKAIVFFLAFIPGFIDPAVPLVPQYAETIGTIVVVDIAVMWGFFAVVARAFRRFGEGERGSRRLGRLFGGLFIGVGGLLALS